MTFSVVLVFPPQLGQPTAWQLRVAEPAPAAAEAPTGALASFLKGDFYPEHPGLSQGYD